MFATITNYQFTIFIELTMTQWFIENLLKIGKWKLKIA